MVVYLLRAMLTPLGQVLLLLSMVKSLSVLVQPSPRPFKDKEQMIIQI